MSKIRKYRKRVVTLLVTLGVLCLLIGSGIEGLAFLREAHERGPFVRLGLYYLSGGALFLLVYGLGFALPEYWRDRRSGVRQRRTAWLNNFQRPPESRRASSSRDGGVLILVLILLGVVAGVSLHALTTARAAQREAAARTARLALERAALDTAREGLQRLADAPEPAEGGAAMPANEESVDPAGVSRMLRFHDLQASFDLNNLAVPVTGTTLPPGEALAGILLRAGEFTPGPRIAALRDWVDTDDAGAWEAPHYAALTPAAVPANRLLLGWDELFQIDGWSAETFARKPYRGGGLFRDADLIDGVSIIPAPRNRVIPVNINTAAPFVLEGLFGIGNEGLVERILALRGERPVASLALLTDVFGAEAFERIAPYLDIRSSFFRIEATAYRDGRTARLHLIARRDDAGRVETLQAWF